MLLCLLMFATLLPGFAFADLATPVLVGATPSGTTVTVEWQEVYGAEGYRVFHKINGAAGWTILADLPAGTTSYVDTGLSAGNTYTYTVRCINSAGTSYTSGYDKNGVSAKIGDLATPVLISATVDGPALLVDWNLVGGAFKYRVYRKEPGKKWDPIADVFTPPYRDTTAKAGVTYTYTVRCLNSSAVVVSGFDGAGVSGSWNKGTAGWLATPKLISAKGQKDGILFKWENVDGNVGYRVYRKDPDKNWAIIADVATDVVEYLDASAPTGKTVYYTVRCLNAAGDLISDYDKNGKSASWTSSTKFSLDTPVLLGAVAYKTGVQVSWNAVVGAKNYRVFRKDAEHTTWAVLATVAAPQTEYVDNTAKSGVKYTYTVRCVNDAGTVFLSDFDKNGVVGSWDSGSTGNVAAPVQDALVINADSIDVSWSAVGGATYYVVYRWDSVTNSTTELGEQTSPFTDTTVSSGVRYTYTIRCADAGHVLISGFSNERTVTFYAAPVMKTAVPDANGLKVTWEAVNGAPGYFVYRDPGAIKLTSSPIQGTSYVDKTANAGVNYTYTLVVVSADGKKELSAHSNPGVVGFYTGKAAITKIERDRTDLLGDFLHVEWSDVPGVDHFILYRKMDAGEWLEWATIPSTDPREFDDDQVVNGSTYAYYVRGYDGGGDPLGTYDPTGKSIVFYASPTLVKVENQGDAIYVEWELVNGISTYRVFRKLNDASWQVVGDVPALAYLDTSIVSESQYTYTVACLDASGNIVSAKAKEVSITSLPFYEQPLLTGVVPDGNGIKVTWQAVNGCPEYLIFRKDDSKTSWGDYIASVYSPVTEFIDYTVLNGGKYSYTVACGDGAGNVASDYNQVGLSTTFYMEPIVTFIETAGNGSIKLTWAPVDGIRTYNIYRKTGSGSWLLLAANVTGTTYNDSNTKNATTYYYSVACTVSGVEVSSYEKTGARMQHFNTPTLISVTNRDGFVELKYGAVDGCTDYKIYRKTGTGPWVILSDEYWINSGDTLIYEDHAIASNTKYTYTVRCMDSGLIISSGFDSKGKALTYMDVPPLGAMTTPKAKTLRFTWTSVPGATKYIVYRKTATTGWVEQTRVTGTTFTQSNLTPGMQYTYTIRAMAADGTISFFDPIGVTGTPTA